MIEIPILIQLDDMKLARLSEDDLELEAKTVADFMSLAIYQVIEGFAAAGVGEEAILNGIVHHFHLKKEVVIRAIQHGHRISEEED